MDKKERKKRREQRRKVERKAWSLYKFWMQIIIKRYFSEGLRREGGKMGTRRSQDGASR